MDITNLKSKIFLLSFSFLLVQSCGSSSDKEYEFPVCLDNTDCPLNMFCKKEIGNCDEFGLCEEKPDVCTEDYNPVCGCDNRTYPNLCHAYMNGISIQYESGCESSSKSSLK